MSTKETLKPEQVAEALNATNGLVYLAAEKLGVHFATVYRYAQRYTLVRQAIDQQKGKRLDVAEAKLWQAVNKGESWAICFLLKTQGKERGYVERTEHEHRGSLVLEIVEEVIHVSHHPAAGGEEAPETNGQAASGPAGLPS